MNDTTDPLIGRIIGENVKITGRLAKGGAGTVYRALQTSTDRAVAVKVLTKKGPNDEETFARYQTEVTSLSRMTHPNVVHLYDCGPLDDDRWFLSMELLSGRSLDEVLKTGPLSVERVVEIVDAVAAILEQAHDLGIVHRDIKPPNIIMQDVGRHQSVRLIDFGIASLKTMPTVGDRPAGTPAYMSPEQINGDALDGRADIFSLGIVAYECLAGRHPFGGDTPVTLMARQVVEPLPPLRDVNPKLQLPPALETVITRMIDKIPAQRPSNVRELRAELGSFLRRSAPPRPASTKGRPTSDARRPFDAEGDTEVFLPQKDVRPRRRFARMTLAFVLIAGLAAFVAIQQLGPKRSLEYLERYVGDISAMNGFGRSSPPQAGVAAPRQTAATSPESRRVMTATQSAEQPGEVRSGVLAAIRSATTSTGGRELPVLQTEP